MRASCSPTGRIPPNYRRDGGWPAIWRAAYNGHLAVVESMLDAGAHELEGALWRAAKKGQTAVIALLLDREADVHYLDDRALHTAAHYGHLEAATLLLERGRAYAWNEILTVALQHKHHAVAALLRAHRAV